MKHRLLRRVGLLAVLTSVGCAEATQAPDAESGSDNAQAGTPSVSAGAAGNPFQPGARAGAGGALDSAGGASDFGGASGAPSVLAAGAGGAGASAGGAASGGASGALGSTGGSSTVGGGAGLDPGSDGGSSSTGSSIGEACAPRTFSYPDPSHALTSVAVSGSFDTWAQVGVPLTYDSAAQSWQLAMTLAAGTYQYKFVVNGTDWKADPGNANSAGDGYGGVNSVIVCQ